MKPSSTKSPATIDQSADRKASISRGTSISQMAWRAASEEGNGLRKGSRMFSP
ncbi:hypothetical protein D3C72_2018910 [compost metagenome]